MSARIQKRIFLNRGRILSSSPWAVLALGIIAAGALGEQEDLAGLRSRRRTEENSACFRNRGFSLVAPTQGPPSSFAEVILPRSSPAVQCSVSQGCAK